MLKLHERVKETWIEGFGIKILDSNLVAESIFSKIGFEEAKRIPKGVSKKGRCINLSRGFTENFARVVDEF